LLSNTDFYPHNRPGFLPGFFYCDLLHKMKGNSGIDFVIISILQHLLTQVSEAYWLIVQDLLINV